ncbi:MAG: transporter substrate-binding domain-containing protein [Holosporales bacterium]|nr:transporter substrate-binding domain-containing protein [Holosporales bacterium]
MKIILPLLSLVLCGIIMFSSKIDTDGNKDTSESQVDVVNPSQFSRENINYQFEHPPPGTDDKKHFGDIDDIVRRGELVVLSRKKDNIPIFQMKTKDGYVGEDIEFAKKLADGLGVKLTIRMIYKDCDDVVNAIANNEGDIGISKISYTNERCMKVLYTNPYVMSGLCMLVNRLAIKRLRINTLQELFNNKNAVIAGHSNTSYEYYARQYATHAKFVSEADWDNVIVNNLKSGKFSATLRDSIVINLLLHKFPELCLEMLPINLKNETDSYAAVVNIKSTSLCVWINKHLAVSSSRPIDTSQLIKKYDGYVK